MDEDVGLEAQLTEALRELAMRQRVYPRWVDAGKITEKTADRRIRLMHAIVLTLQRALESDRLI